MLGSPKPRLVCTALAIIPWLPACIDTPVPDSPEGALPPIYYPNQATYDVSHYTAAPQPPVLPPGAAPPPAAPRPQCLNSQRGTAHTFAGRLEVHPDGSGKLRLLLDQPVCFDGGEYSRGTTDSILVEGDASAAASMVGRRVEARGISVDPPPAGAFRYVFHLGSVALTSSK